MSTISKIFLCSCFFVARIVWRMLRILRKCCSSKKQLIFSIMSAFLLYYTFKKVTEPELITEYDHQLRYVENKLQEQLKRDKGTGCEVPYLDPFAEEIMQFDKEFPKVKCDGLDWVKCYFSECKVIDEILDTHMNVTCAYRDIVYENDDRYWVGAPAAVAGAAAYRLARSDHVHAACSATRRRPLFFKSAKWSGYAAGLRSTVARHPSPEGREDTTNILIFAFDSAARNGFIRRMPKSYKYLWRDLQSVILRGYNVVGDGTPAALFPILTGKNELEMPDARKKMKNNLSVDDMPFIFFKLRDDGYRTAYLEDSPAVGTFQYRFNGFRRQPTDHYMRAFFLEEARRGKPWWAKGGGEYCVGDTPRYKLMMNLTHQFMHLDGKKFILTFVADITHDNFNMITTADEDFLEFLKSFKSGGFLNDTMLFVMGDHGPRYAYARNTYQGKLEERLPLMAIVMPEKLKSKRPSALAALRRNSRVLTTPHDVHATLLDAMDLNAYWNPYKVPGADLPRAMSLLKPIPSNRSCSEAGIEPHWCACLTWRNVTDRRQRARAAAALVDFINGLTAPVRSKCVPRTLSSVEWLAQKQASRGVLSFVAARDADGLVGRFGDQIPLPRETYQVKITVEPGKGFFEASMTYLVYSDEFHFDVRDISRTNMYRNEPHCISATHPHLNPYCYCADLLEGQSRM